MNQRSFWIEQPQVSSHISFGTRKALPVRTKQKSPAESGRAYACLGNVVQNRKRVPIATEPREKLLGAKSQVTFSDASSNSNTERQMPKPKARFI